MFQLKKNQQKNKVSISCPNCTPKKPNFSWYIKNMLRHSCALMITREFNTPYPATPSTPFLFMLFIWSVPFCVLLIYQPSNWRFMQKIISQNFGQFFLVQKFSYVRYKYHLSHILCLFVMVNKKVNKISRKNMPKKVMRLFSFLSSLCHTQIFFP